MIARTNNRYLTNLIAVGVLLAVTVLLNLHYIVKPYVPRGDGYRIPHHLAAIDHGDQSLLSSWNSSASLGFPALADPERMYELSWFLDLEDPFFRLKFIAFLCLLQLAVACSAYILMKRIFHRSWLAALFGSLTLFASYAITITYNGRPTVAYEYLALIWMIYCYERSFTQTPRMRWLAACTLIVGLGMIYRPTNIAALALIVLFVVGLLNRMHLASFNWKSVLISTIEPILVVLAALVAYSTFTLPLLELNPSGADLTQRYTFTVPISTYLTFAIPSLAVLSFLFIGRQGFRDDPQTQKFAIILGLCITGVVLYSVYFPATELRTWFFTNLPLVKHVRNPYFLITLFSVFFALLVATSFDRIALHPNKKFAKFLPVIVTLVAVTLLNADKILFSPLAIFTDSKAAIVLSKQLGSIGLIVLVVYLLFPVTRLKPEAVKTYAFVGLGVYLILMAIPGFGISKSSRDLVSKYVLKKPIAIKYAYPEKKLLENLAFSQELADKYPTKRVLGEGLYAPVATVPKFSNHLSKETRWYLSNLFKTDFLYPRPHWVLLWLREREPERFNTRRYQFSRLDQNFLQLGNISIINGKQYSADWTDLEYSEVGNQYFAIRQSPQMYRLYSDFMVETDPDRIAQLISSGGPLDRLFLENNPGFEATATKGFKQSVDVHKHLGRVIEIGVSSNRDALLFVPDAYAEGWTATVNGIPTEIIRANFAFRAVRVPKGDSSVTMEYQTPNGNLYTMISLFGLLVLILLFVFPQAKMRFLSRSSQTN